MLRTAILEGDGRGLEEIAAGARSLDLTPVDLVCRGFEDLSGKVAVLDSEGRTSHEIADVR